MKECKRCLMNDSNDDFIKFDENGYCNYCTRAIELINNRCFNDPAKLEILLKKIRDYGKNKKYDCLMGISGGLDSSYLAYLGAMKWNLRILAIHVDDGFDTEISKRNIERLSKMPNMTLINFMPDAEQYNDLTLSYIKASVPQICIPQDNILFAHLYKYARKYGFKYFLSGSNFATESILQYFEGGDADDVVNIKDIHKRYGTKPINKLEFCSKIQKYINRKIFHYETICPLNYIEYTREKAFKELNEGVGFEYYGSKHLENTLTAFTQLIWLPRKFKIDKRLSHLSSMIVSGQLTKKEAVDELNSKTVTDEQLNEIYETVCDKLGISKLEMENYMNMPGKKHTDYKIDVMAIKIRNLLKKILNL